jgi:hypothetical protein
MLRRFRDCAERTVSRFEPANKWLRACAVAPGFTLGHFGAIGGKRIPIAISAWI